MSREERTPVWVEWARPLTLGAQTEDDRTQMLLGQAEYTGGTEAQKAGARPAEVFKRRQLNFVLGFAMGVEHTSDDPRSHTSGLDVSGAMSGIQCSQQRERHKLSNSSTYCNG